jgi:hypothetical protein
MMTTPATNDNAISAHDPEWQRYAVQFARLRVPFVVRGLNDSLDAPFCHAIKDKFKLDATFDARSNQMHFVPKA